jgi:hypothetical protein
MLDNFVEPNGEFERGQEIQEGKARCPSAQEEGDEKGDAGEKEKETGAKARARSDRATGRIQ